MAAVFGSYLDDIYRLCTRAARNVVPNKGLTTGGNVQKAFVYKGKINPFTTLSDMGHMQYFKGSPANVQILPNAFFARMPGAGSGGEVCAKLTNEGIKVAGRIKPYGLQGPLDTTFAGTLSHTTLKSGVHVNSLNLDLSQYVNSAGELNYSLLRSGRDYADLADDLVGSKITMDVAYKNGERLGHRYTANRGKSTIKKFFDGKGEWKKTVTYRADGTRAKVRTSEGTAYYDNNGLPIADDVFQTKHLLG